MKSIKAFFVLLLIFLLGDTFSSQVKTEWKGTIEKENEIPVIKNPREPLFGEFIFELELDLLIGSRDDDNSTFYNYVMIAVDSKGCIFVLDSANCRIQKFSEIGDFLYSMGREGQGPGEFMRASELILDFDDNVYVRESRKLHKFSHAGKFVKSIW